MRMRYIAAAAVIAVLLALTGVFFYASGPSRPSAKPGIKEYDVSQAQPKGGGLVLMTYNIGYASGLQNNTASVLTASEVYSNLDRIVDTILRCRADIVALQEIDFHSRRTRYIDELDYLAKKAGFPHAAYILNWNKRYVPYPYTINFSKQFGRMESGQAVLSRFPILENKCGYLAKPFNKPFWYKAFYIRRAVQRVRIQLPRREIQVFNAHLEAYDTPTRMYQALQLVDLRRSCDFGNAFVAGDFNSVPPDAAQKNGFADEPGTDFTGDNTIQVISQKSGLLELIPDITYRQHEKQAFTFPSDNPTRRLDYMFYSGSFTARAWKVDAAAGSPSDHLPLAGVFAY